MKPTTKSVLFSIAFLFCLLLVADIVSPLLSMLVIIYAAFLVFTSSSKKSDDRSSGHTKKLMGATHSEPDSAELDSFADPRVECTPGRVRPELIEWAVATVRGEDFQNECRNGHPGHVDNIADPETTTK